MKTLKYKKFTGLHIVCKACNRFVEVTQTIYKGCLHPIEKQRYKAVINANGLRKTRDLKSKQYDEAVKELLEFKEQINNPLKFKPIESNKESKPELLVDCIFMFSDWLENINIPKHEQKKRSTKYIKETVGYVIRFKDFLEPANRNTLKVTEIDKHAFGKYYEHLEKITNSTTTFNHNLRALKGFYNFLINEKGYLIANLAKKAKLKHENPDPISIDDNDFIKLLESVTPQNSIEVYKTKKGTKTSKNRYKPYIKASFELAAYTGMRLEEVSILKYKDIKLDNEGNLLYLEGTDLKFERAHNWDNTKAKKTVPIPITPELEDLLNRLNYKANIGSDRYLIDGDETMSRASLAKQMSHSFTFFRRKAGLSDKFSLKHLRKTFLTKLEIQTGLATAAGYQKTAIVIQKNYIDKRMVTAEIMKKGFRFFK